MQKRGISYTRVALGSPRHAWEIECGSEKFPENWIKLRVTARTAVVINFWIIDSWKSSSEKLYCDDMRSMLINSAVNHLNVRTQWNIYDKTTGELYSFLLETFHADVRKCLKSKRLMPED